LPYRRGESFGRMWDGVAEGLDVVTGEAEGDDPRASGVRDGGRRLDLPITAEKLAASYMFRKR
jgi:hypothetical protein